MSIGSIGEVSAPGGQGGGVTDTPPPPPPPGVVEGAVLDLAVIATVTWKLTLLATGEGKEPRD